MVVSIAFEEGALTHLEETGEKAPLNSAFRTGMVAIFARRPWENCKAISFAIANGEEAFESLKKERTNVALYFTRQTPFFLHSQERDKKPTSPRKPIRDLCEVF